MGWDALGWEGGAGVARRRVSGNDVSRDERVPRWPDGVAVQGSGADGKGTWWLHGWVDLGVG